MILNIFFIRHGLSCSNVLHYTHPHASIINTCNKDPFLSTMGVNQSKKSSVFLAKKIPSFDIVLSSPLIRAIETGLCMFPNNIVEISPYICEIRNSLENIPFSQKKQIDRLSSKNESYKQVKFCYNTPGLTDNNLKKFIKYLLQNYDVESKNIAVITHSLFLMKILKTKDKMKNNSVTKVTIDTDTYQISNVTNIFSGYVCSKDISIKMAFR